MAESLGETAARAKTPPAASKSQKAEEEVQCLLQSRKLRPLRWELSGHCASECEAPSLSRPPCLASDSPLPPSPLTSLSLCLSVPCHSTLQLDRQTDPCGPSPMSEPHSLSHAQNIEARLSLPTRVPYQQDYQINLLVLSMGCVPPSTGVPNSSNKRLFLSRLLPQSQIEGNRTGKSLPWVDLSLF